MGHVHTTIGLRNPRLEDSRVMQVRALVDTGANHLCLPASVVAQLGLDADSVRTVTTADGTVHRCRYAGPIKVSFEDRECYVGALELDEEVLLGAIPMEDMDLVVSPSRLSVTTNPEHSDSPRSYAMGLRP